MTIDNIEQTKGIKINNLKVKLFIFIVVSYPRLWQLRFFAVLQNFGSNLACIENTLI